ncbi:hypothetical protein BV898_08733 [Hypsibius exemplaris]|uniref:RRM domain-containing protein n=1 Tax=Hypsibius exemplaris TaxID=2072580 RepID=A0A1W0WPT3_HYPEX|nr:hypothetical protein BV898_08733 [Hypsibius exemplaris]
MPHGDHGDFGEEGSVLLRNFATTGAATEWPHYFSPFWMDRELYCDCLTTDFIPRAPKFRNIPAMVEEMSAVVAFPKELSPFGNALQVANSTLPVGMRIFEVAADFADQIKTAEDWGRREKTQNVEKRAWGYVNHQLKNIDEGGPAEEADLRSALGVGPNGDLVSDIVRRMRQHKYLSICHDSRGLGLGLGLGLGSRSRSRGLGFSVSVSGLGLGVLVSGSRSRVPVSGSRSRVSVSGLGSRSRGLGLGSRSWSRGLGLGSRMKYSRQFFQSTFAHWNRLVSLEKLNLIWFTDSQSELLNTMLRCMGVVNDCLKPAEQEFQRSCNNRKGAVIDSTYPLLGELGIGLVPLADLRGKMFVFFLSAEDMGRLALFIRALNTALEAFFKPKGSTGATQPLVHVIASPDVMKLRGIVQFFDSRAANPFCTVELVFSHRDVLTLRQCGEDGERQSTGCHGLARSGPYENALVLVRELFILKHIAAAPEMRFGILLMLDRRRCFRQLRERLTAWELVSLLYVMAESIPFQDFSSALVRGFSVLAAHAPDIHPLQIPRPAAFPADLSATTSLTPFAFSSVCGDGSDSFTASDNSCLKDITTKIFNKYLGDVLRVSQNSDLKENYAASRAVIREHVIASLQNSPRVPLHNTARPVVDRYHKPNVIPHSGAQANQTPVGPYQPRHYDRQTWSNSEEVPMELDEPHAALTSTPPGEGILTPSMLDPRVRQMPAFHTGRSAILAQSGEPGSRPLVNNANANGMVATVLQERMLLLQHHQLRLQQTASALPGRTHTEMFNATARLGLEQPLDPVYNHYRRVESVTERISSAESAEMRSRHRDDGDRRNDSARDYWVDDSPREPRAEESQLESNSTEYGCRKRTPSVEPEHHHKRERSEARTPSSEPEHVKRRRSEARTQARRSEDREEDIGREMAKVGTRGWSGYKPDSLHRKSSKERRRSRSPDRSERPAQHHHRTEPWRRFSDETIFVQDLSMTTTREDVMDLFRKVAPVIGVYLSTSKWHSSSLFALIGFANASVAQRVVKELQGVSLNGRKLRLILSTEQSRLRMKENVSDRFDFFLNGIDTSIRSKAIHSQLQRMDYNIEDVFMGKSGAFVRFQRGRDAEKFLAQGSIVILGRKCFIEVSPNALRNFR